MFSTLRDLIESNEEYLNEKGHQLLLSDSIDDDLKDFLLDEIDQLFDDSIDAEDGVFDMLDDGVLIGHFDEELSNYDVTQLVEQGYIDSDNIYACTRAEVSVENDYLYTVERDEKLERLRGIYRDSNHGVEFVE